MVTTRPRFNAAAAAEDLMAALAVIRPTVVEAGHTDALATVETFCAIALRVMAKTNASRIASEARTVELSTLVPPTPRTT